MSETNLSMQALSPLIITHQTRLRCAALELHLLEYQAKDKKKRKVKEKSRAKTSCCADWISAKPENMYLASHDRLC